MAQPHRFEQIQTPFSAVAAGTGAFLCWRPEWDLGVPEMDDDHRALAEALNGLAGAVEPPWRLPVQAAAAQGRRTQLSALRTLHDRAAEHFAREEALMRETAYPRLAEHRSEHRLLLAELTTLLRDQQRQRPGYALERATVRELKLWFLGHLLDMDRQLAHHLRRAGIPAGH